MIQYRFTARTVKITLVVHAVGIPKLVGNAFGIRIGR